MALLCGGRFCVSRSRLAVLARMASGSNVRLHTCTPLAASRTAHHCLMETPKSIEASVRSRPKEIGAASHRKLLYYAEGAIDNADGNQLPFVRWTNREELGFKLFGACWPAARRRRRHALAPKPEG